MSILQSLKLSSVQRNTQLSPAVQRRTKLVNKLHEQLMLAQALSDGKTYEIAVTRRFKDKDSGEMKKVDGVRKVKPWFFMSDSGSPLMQIRYGTKVLELAKGKCSIEIGSPEKLIPTIEILKKAVLDGELDVQLAKAIE
jgi:hypothetical protein